MLSQTSQSEEIYKRNNAWTFDLQQILSESVRSTHKVYSTSDTFYYAKNIEQAIKNRKCRLRTFLKDEKCNSSTQHLTQYKFFQSSQRSLKKLAEYYKYYTQTTILYLPEFFKSMHNNREKKKVVDYNKLKKILDLSDITQPSELQTRHNYRSFRSFHLISLLNKTSTTGDQTMLFKGLVQQLNNVLGYQKRRSMGQVDKNYYFQQKLSQRVPNFERSVMKNNYCKSITDQKEASKHFRSEKVKKSKRNNSCDQFWNEKQKKAFPQHRIYLKKKHNSLDTLQQLKSGQTKIKLRLSKTKYTLVDQQYVKQTIKAVKERIQKQKVLLKKKNVGMSNQSQLTATSKKSPNMTGSKMGFSSKPNHLHFL